MFYFEHKLVTLSINGSLWTYGLESWPEGSYFNAWWYIKPISHNVANNFSQSSESPVATFKELVLKFPAHCFLTVTCIEKFWLSPQQQSCICKKLSSSSSFSIESPCTAGMWSCTAGMWSCTAGMWSCTAGMWSCTAGMWSCTDGMWSCTDGMWPHAGIHFGTCVPFRRGEVAA